FNLAVISEQNGDFDGAIKAYQAALDLGIEKAEMNLRNVKTKKFAKMAKEIGEAQEKEQFYLFFLFDASDDSTGYEGCKRASSEMVPSADLDGGSKYLNEKLQRVKNSII
ncbi:hypothetical protein BGW38_001228, partial [Lunasporangiospora selenospora]